MDVTLKEKKSFVVRGIELRTTNRNGESLKQIPAFWQRFYREKLAEKIPGAIKPDIIYALYTDYDEQGYYSMLLGVESKKMKCDESLWRSVTVPAARYAVMTAKGIIPYAVPSAWEYVFSDQFMHTRAFCADFEVYDQRSKCVHDAEVDLYVSILK